MHTRTCINALAIALAPAVGADMRRFEFSANLFAMADSSSLQDLIWRAQDEFRVLLGDGGAASSDAAAAAARDHCESQLLPQLTEHKEVAGLLQQELAEECARVRNDATSMDVSSGDEKDQQDDRLLPANVHVKAESLAHLQDAQACARAAETEPPSDPGGDVVCQTPEVSDAMDDKDDKAPPLVRAKRRRASREVMPPSDSMDDKYDKAPPRVRAKRRQVSWEDMPPSDAMDDNDDKKLLEDTCRATADPLPLGTGEWQGGTRYRLKGK